jgi:hypothetical protein
MATFIYLVVNPIYPNNRQQGEKNKIKVLHGAWFCSLKQINKGTVLKIDTPYMKVLQLKECFLQWGYCKPNG